MDLSGGGLNGCAILRIPPINHMCVPGENFCFFLWRGKDDGFPCMAFGAGGGELGL